MTTKQTPALPIEIVVEGQLGEHWIAWFEGMQITNLPDGRTMLSGTVPDQAALQGLIGLIFDLNLTLVYLKRLD